jgi:DMSO/TMAO reductase YedYZ heme-binding membrane subunit
LFLAFAASSLQVLFPSELTRWLMRNRKIMGLCFAAAMAWQGFFILWLTTVYRDYYIQEVYVLRDAIEGTVGYLFLAAMTVTSFSFGRKRLSPKAWRYLHKSGVYFLWAYAYTVYWWNLFYYPGPIWLDYVYYIAGLGACALRPLAWRKKRMMKMQNAPATAIVPAVFQLAGWMLVSAGVVVAFITPMWRQLSEDVLTGYALTAFAEKYVPYWPFEPFIPLLIIALGAWMTTWVRPIEMRMDPGTSPG